MDQHDQDQVVGLQYADNGTTRAAGLNVWDRPTKISLKELIEGRRDQPINKSSGRERVRILVDPAGKSRMEFLDETSKVIRSLP